MSDNFVPDDDEGQGVEVVIDKPKGVSGDPAPKDDDISSVAEELKRNLKAKDDELAAERRRAEGERLRAQDAERRAQELENRTLHAQKEIVSTRRVGAEATLATVKEMIASTKREMNQLAAEAKDTADISERLTDLVSKRRELERDIEVINGEEGRQELERTATTQQTTQRQQQPQISRETQDWIDKHSDQWKDPKFREEAVYAHRDAVSRGYRPDSDSYFRHVEKYMGIEGDAQTQGDPDPEPKETKVATPAADTQRRTSPAAAAPSRAPSTPQHNAQGKKVIRLSAAEREQAELMRDTYAITHPGENYLDVHARSIAGLDSENPNWRSDSGRQK